MTAVSNFRDFGGGAVAGGGCVRRGLLYRSGQTGPLGDMPFAELIARDFAVIADLRFPDEVRSAPMPWPPSLQARVLGLDGDDPGGPAPHHALIRGGIPDVAAVRDRYARFYTTLPADPRYQSLSARTMRAIAAADGPALLHCSAGKDRTGFLCGLILATLGVARAAIVDDYLLSASFAAREALRPELLRRLADHGVPEPDPAAMDAMLTVEREYLLASFAAIDDLAGSIEGYLDRIGIDRDARRALKDRLIV